RFLVPAHAFDDDVALRGYADPSLHRLQGPWLDQHLWSTRHPTVFRKRILHLPVTSVLFDDPAGTVRRRPDRWRERVRYRPADHPTTHSAGDRDDCAVPIPWLVPRLPWTADLPHRRDQVHPFDRPHDVLEPAQYRVGAAHGRIGDHELADHHPVFLYPT